MSESNSEHLLVISEAAEKAGLTTIYDEDTGIFTFTDGNTGIEIKSVLQGSDQNGSTRILYNQVVIGNVLAEVAEKGFAQLLKILTDVENGIITSSYQTAKLENGDYQILLCNYAPIQKLDNDDCQDIQFVIEALMVDIWDAVASLDGFIAA